MTISGHMLRMAGAANNAVPTNLVPGDMYGGGYFYAYMKFPNDVVYAMILAPKSAETQIAWSTVVKDDPGAVSLINGWENCASLSGPNYPAVQYCRSYTGGGHSDWYLAAPYEIEPAYRVFKPTTGSNTTNQGSNPYTIPPSSNYTVANPAQTTIPEFAQGGAQAFEASSYWVSNQLSESQANRKFFSNGSEGGFSKNNATIWVRPIRKVRVS